MERKIFPVDYLIPMPLDILDFYPPGFELEVEKGLPFRNHNWISKEFLDSLYYSFSPMIRKNKREKIIRDANLYPFSLGLNSRLAMINLMSLFAYSEADTEYIKSDTIKLICGIDPASIKAIREKEFQNTLISTREFESRLKTIFATCDTRVLELYVNNLNKNLWEIDEMAANLLGNSHEQYSKFIEFALYKQTTVKLTDKKAKKIAEYYVKRKLEIDKELLKQKEEYIKSKKKHEKEIKQKENEYRTLLDDRHRYRMKKFGFELKDLGWYNAANEISINNVETFKLNLKVSNGLQYDRVFTYVINPKIKSIFSLLSSDKMNFNEAYSEDSHLLLWKNQQFKVIGIGYKNDQTGYKIVELEQQPIVNAELNIVDVDVKTLKEELKKINGGYNSSNKISVDLEYQTLFYREQKKKEKEVEEYKFIMHLRLIVFPCCAELNLEQTDEKQEIDIE